MGTAGPLGRRGRAAVAGAMLVLGLLAGPAALLSQARQPQEAKVRLSWAEGWTPAGIAVEAGDTLSIRVRTIKGATPREDLVRNPATGAMVPRSQLRPESGAQRESLAATLLNRAARQVILGRLGEGRPFVVGRNFSEVMKAGGPLSLRWNVPREAAGEQAFDVVVRVEPGPDGGGGGEDNLVETNGAGTGGSLGNLTGTNTVFATNNVVEVEGNDAAVETANIDGEVQQPEENVAAIVEPVTPRPPEDRAVEDPSRNVSAADTETRLSVAQTAVAAAALAAVLLLLAAAGIAVQRWRRRRLLNRTRSLLALSPSLDLGEGACRGGERPAGEPAVSIRTRLEQGATRSTGGAKHG
jgi:hypothetical protein